MMVHISLFHTLTLYLYHRSGVRCTKTCEFDFPGLQEFFLFVRIFLGCFDDNAVFVVHVNHVYVYKPASVFLILMHLHC